MASFAGESGLKSVLKSDSSEPQQLGNSRKIVFAWSKDDHPRNTHGYQFFAKTYGDLTTSIINPDHVLSDQYLDLLPREDRSRVNSSPMYLNEDMKVTELIDIVAFLNSRYRLLPGYTEYYY